MKKNFFGGGGGGGGLTTFPGARIGKRQRKAAIISSNITFLPSKCMTEGGIQSVLSSLMILI